MCIGRRMQPCARIDRRHRRQRMRHLRHAAIDHQIGLIHAAKFFGAAMHVNQALLRTRRFYQRIAAGRHFAQARPDRQYQIGVHNACGELGVDANADVTRVIRMTVIEQILEAECACHRQSIYFGKMTHRLAAAGIPAAASQQHDRSLRCCQHVAQLRHLCSRWRRLYRLIRFGVGYDRFGDQHVFRQCQHHRTRTAGCRNLERAGDVFGDAVGAVDLRHPFRHLAEHAAIVDFLKCFAFDEVVADLADEQDHRR